jgi:hypothetical protein
MLLKDYLEQKMAGLDPVVEVIETKPRKKIFTERRYDVIGFRLNGETMTTKKPVAIITAKKVKIRFKRAGCHRVDILEVSSKVNGEPLEFTEKNYVAPFETKYTPGTPVMSEIRVNAQRLRIREKAEANFAKKNHSTETRSDQFEVMIFTLANDLVYKGPEEGAGQFILNSKLKLEELVIYMPNKTYRKLVG